MYVGGQLKKIFFQKLKILKLLNSVVIASTELLAVFRSLWGGELVAEWLKLQLI